MDPVSPPFLGPIESVIRSEHQRTRVTRVTRHGSDPERNAESEVVADLVHDVAEAFDTRCRAMLAAEFVEVEAHNPYWDVKGRTFVDRDGYRVVVQQAPWPNR